MALVLKDRVKETSTTTGTGSLTLLGASTGYQTFSSAIGNTNTTYYTIQSYNSSEWEVGIGTVSAGSLSRDTVLASSTGAKVSFSAGTKDVFCTYPAGKSVYADASGYVSGYTIENSSIGATTASTGKFTSVTTPSVTASSTDLTLSAISTGAVKLNTLNGEAFRVVDLGATTTNFMRVSGGTSGNAPSFYSVGGDTNVDFACNTKGTGAFRFYTNQAQEQLRISHTASAVNYVQVTGGITGNNGVISAQGSDSSVGLTFSAKNAGNILFQAAGGTNFETRYTATTPINYLSATGSLTTIAPTLSSRGNDTNIAMGFISKGTGAIDLAAGSSGVNISNGGTVTAVTRTASGSGYTSFPTVAVSAPTTAGGVQATILMPYMFVTGGTVASGGTGYTVGDTLTMVGGTPQTVAGTLTVASVSGGVITSLSGGNFANYSVLPTNPISMTGGTGTGASINVTYGVSSTGFAVNNAGSGYIEQPTVSFSGGGGSGAAAIAKVGSSTTFKSLAGVSSFNTYAGEGLRINNDGFSTLTDYVEIQGGASVSGAYIGVNGSTTTASLYISGKGGGTVDFFTNGQGNARQARVSHTASVVNYLQLTGAPTTGTPIISAQGSDSNIPIQLRSKGTFNVSFANGAGNSGLVVDMTSGATLANYVSIAPKIAGSSPIISALGTDTNIDLVLSPKGTGGVSINSAIKLGAGASAGTSGQVLTSAGAGASPTWTTPSSGGIGGATETTTSSDVTLTSTSNRVQKVTQTGLGKAFNLPDATTFSASGSPIFNLGTVSGSPMFIKYSDGYRCGSVTTTTGAQVSLSNITNAQTGYAINNVYPIIKVTDEAVALSTSIGSNADGTGTSQYISIDQIDTNTFIVGYINVSTATAYVVVATQSGSTFSFGTPVALTNAAGSTSMINVVGLSTTTAFVVFVTSSGNTQCQGLTISGTTVTASTVANITTNNGPLYRAVKLSSTTALFTSTTGTVGTSSLNLKIATHNGASAPTFGGAVTLNTSVGTSPVSLCMLSSTKFVTFFSKSKGLYAQCGTISGVTITLGTELTITSSVSSNNSFIKGSLAYSATEAFFIGTDYYGYVTVSGTTITSGSLNTGSTYSVSNALVAPYTTTGSTLMNDSLILTYSGSGSFTIKSSPSYIGQNYSTGLGNVIAGSSTSYINAGTQYATQYPAIWITAQVA